MSTAPDTLGRVPQWTVGDRLRKARQHRNVSADEMANIIGRGVRTIYNYENGNTRVPKLIRRVYAGRLDVPLSWIETGEESPDSPGEDIAPVTLGYAVKRAWRRVPWAA